MVSPGCTETLPELPGRGDLLVFAVCDFDTSLPYPLVRDPVPGLGSVESALTSLVRGTTAAEQENGLMVGFDWVESSDADRIRVEANIDAAGVVDLEFVLDGEPWHPGTLAGTSFQAFSFVDPLYATLFQFSEVTGIGPGSLCWGELDCTQVFSREMWESMVRANARRDVGSGCGMLGAWFDPACGASLPLCGDGLEIVSGSEGATGSAVYYLEITAPEACFMELDGMVTVFSADGAVADVDGSPLTVEMAGVVTDRFTALDGSMPMWVMRNWCQEGGTVWIEVNGDRYEHPAGGRCDVPDERATLRNPLAVQPPEEVTSGWPTGTVTCAELEGNFPSGLDDYGVYLDEGLVSYFRASGEDAVEEVFVQFLDDPTCTIESDAWVFMISHLLDAESLYGSGHLCDFYTTLNETDPPPANLDTILDQLGDAEQLCS